MYTQAQPPPPPPSFSSSFSVHFGFLTCPSFFFLFGWSDGQQVSARLSGLACLPACVCLFLSVWNPARLLLRTCVRCVYAEPPPLRVSFPISPRPILMVLVRVGIASHLTSPHLTSTLSVSIPRLSRVEWGRLRRQPLVCVPLYFVVRQLASLSLSPPLLCHVTTHSHTQKKVNGFARSLHPSPPFSAAEMGQRCMGTVQCLLRMHLASWLHWDR